MNIKMNNAHLLLSHLQEKSKSSLFFTTLIKINIHFMTWYHENKSCIYKEKWCENKKRKTFAMVAKPLISITYACASFKWKRVETFFYFISFNSISSSMTRRNFNVLKNRAERTFPYHFSSFLYCRLASLFSFRLLIM